MLSAEARSTYKSPVLVGTLTTEFQTASGSKISTQTVRWELHEMGFRGRAAKRRLEWCKARPLDSGAQETVLWGDE
jgi:hypothetical protein